MDNKRRLILVSNDDGYSAKGINELIDAVKHLGDVLVVAPDGPRSGMSSAITSIHPIRHHLIKKEDNVTIYACTGTPVDCVKLGISQIADRKPDLVVSGVNHGSNSSISVLYSGTMGAAIEGCLFQIPSIGFSVTDHSHDANFEVSKTVIKTLSEQVLKSGLPKGICLNVNIPKGDILKGMKICRQTQGQWVEEFKCAEDGIGKKVFWLTGRFENHEPSNQTTDEWALNNGYASIVPVTVDMTAHEFMSEIKSWEDLL